MAPDDKANVIREMIRHEDDLLLGRTNWLMTLQGLLFAALAFGWDRPWLPFLIVALGILFSTLFIPYLNLSEQAIAQLLGWWKENGAGYDGPPITGLEYKNIPGVLSKILPWNLMPYVFIVAWLVFLLVQLRELKII